MNMLTIQNRIDIDQFIKTHSSEMEQIVFILSLYFDLSIEQIKKMDARVINIMTEEVNIYVTKIGIKNKCSSLENKTFLKEELNRVTQKGKINSRFEIIDL